MNTITEINRYSYSSKEGIADCMFWAGLSEDEVNKRLCDYIPQYYDRLEKQYISVEEYNRRVKEKTPSAYS